MGDAPAIRFAMHGAREAIAAGMTHIERQVESIEQSLIENPGLVFGLAKTPIQSALRTVLTERGTAQDNTVDGQK